MKLHSARFFRRLLRVVYAHWCRCRRHLQRATPAQPVELRTLAALQSFPYGKRIARRTCRGSPESGLGEHSKARFHHSREHETLAYLEINTNSTVTVKSRAGVLDSIVVNAPGSGTIQIADALTNVAPYIAGATAFALPPAGTTLGYGTEFYTGLTVTVAGMTDGSITLSYQ